MNCKETRFVMDLYITGDSDLTTREHVDFEKHLQNCQNCAVEYNESKCVIQLLKQHCQISNDTLALIRNTNKFCKLNMTAEEGWQNLLRRCPDLARNTKQQKSFPLILRISAVAACLVIGVISWFGFSNYSKPHSLLRNFLHQRVASALKPSVKIELISEKGNTSVSDGQQITSDGKLKTLLINDKHRMMINTGTLLSIESLTGHNWTGYLVKLTYGEIYTHVEHDGKPFIVQTPHGQATITGTTFDIKVTEDTTILAVTEGTVQFQSDKGVVMVEANQLSKIIKLAAPTEPILCHALELTAWATNFDTKPTFTEFGSSLNTSDLPCVTITTEPVVLENINSHDWVEQKRAWFKQQFPWIFQLKDALAKEGIEVNYPELLIQTGDIWQFLWPETSPAKFSTVNPGSLLKTASAYGFDKEWLQKNVSAVRYAVKNLAFSKDSATGLMAFEQWLECLGKPECPTQVYSYDAVQYIIETRSLIWFMFRDGKTSIPESLQTEVLDLLQQEVTTTCRYKNDLLLLMGTQQKVSCDDNIYTRFTINIRGYIKTIKTTEEKLAQYKISK
jgi:hypothetical protein